MSQNELASEFEQKIKDARKQKRRALLALGEAVFTTIPHEELQQRCPKEFLAAIAAVEAEKSERARIERLKRGEVERARESKEMVNGGCATSLFCPICGWEILPGEKYCSRCGADAAELFGGTAQCPRCSMAVEASMKFCPHCGQDLAGA